MRNSIGTWVRTVLTTDSDADPVFDTAGLDTATKWAAAGFTALAAVLTFFGIKEGILDRLLRAEPTTALWVFCLVGLGVVLGLAAPAFQAKARLVLFPVVAAVLVLTVLTIHFLPNVTGQGANTWTNPLGIAVVAVLGVITIVFMVFPVRVPLAVAVLVVAVTATSMGLFGAAKLSVLSKTFTVDARVTATLDKTDSGEKVTVKVLGNKRENAPLYVRVVGIAWAEGPQPSYEEVVGGAELVADDAGNIDTSIDVPVDTTQWDWISVRSCADVWCAPGDERVGLSGALGSRRAMQMSGTLTAGSGGAPISGSLTAVRVPRGCAVVGLVYRQAVGGGPVVVSRASLPPDANGSVSWTPSNIPGATGDQLWLKVIIGAAGQSFCPVASDDEQEVAFLAV